MDHLANAWSPLQNDLVHFDEFTPEYFPVQQVIQHSEPLYPPSPISPLAFQYDYQPQCQFQFHETSPVSHFADPAVETAQLHVHSRMQQLQPLQPLQPAPVDYFSDNHVQPINYFSVLHAQQLELEENAQRSRSVTPRWDFELAETKEGAKKRKERMRPNFSLNKKCANCGTMKTPCWRRDDKGETECNACNQWRVKKGFCRPLALRTDEILKRKSRPAVND